MVDDLQERYELGPLLGRGATSRVVKAVDRRLHRDVAVKIIDVAPHDEAARARFVREVQAAGRLLHPNVVTVYDAGDTGDALFIAMALVEGEDLASRLRADAPLPAAEARRIAIEVLHALEAAHDAGIVHRDVKPSNVLLGPGRTVRLADFGIAKPLGDLTSGLTATGQIIGTMAYLAPEQAAGQPVTPAADLYALGVVLYEMLSGTKPFVADTPVAVAVAHQRDEPPPLGDRVPDLDPALAAVVHRALQKRPEDRFPDARAMRAALEDPSAAATAIAPAPVAEPVPAPAAAGGRRVPTWWVVSAAAVVAAVVLLLVFAGGGADAPETAAAPGDTTTTTEQPTTTTTTSTSVPETTTTTTTAPAPTLGALTDRLSDDPDAYGEKGEDLLDKLQEVQRESGDKRAEKARKLLQEIDKWVAEGELDRGIAADAREVLAPIAG